jgi:spermidine/putrescine transport system permease protein
VAIGAFAGGPAVSAAGAADGVKRSGPIVLLLLLPGVVYLALTYVAPLLSLAVTSLESPSPNFDGTYYFTGNAGNYSSALEQYAGILGRSFGWSLLATLFTLLLGYPLAYFIGVTLRKYPFWQSMALILVIAPFFISFLLRTLAWKSIFSDDGPVVTALQAVAILPEGAHITGTPFMVVFGLTYNFLPFTVLPIYTSLERLDLRFVEASGDLYAGRWATFWRVVFPLSLPGVVSGTLLTFIPATGDYVNADRSFLGSVQTQMIGNVINDNFLASENNTLPIAAAMSIVLMIAILIPVAVYVTASKTEDLL